MVSRVVVFLGIHSRGSIREIQILPVFSIPTLTPPFENTDRKPETKVGRKDGRTGRTDRKPETKVGRKDGRTDRQTPETKVGQKDGRADRLTDRQTDH